MRELTGALSIAVADPSIRHVLLTGTGPSFCCGGDLDDFGSRPTQRRLTSLGWRDLPLVS